MFLCLIGMRQSFIDMFLCLIGMNQRNISSKRRAIIDF
jgi:hypothetical protein